VTSVGCVVLSQGTRFAELQATVRSVLEQEAVAVHVVVVGNGWTPTGLPDVVGTVALPDNVGIPEGRNVGARAVEGDVLFFLDDDAQPVGKDFLARVVAEFDGDPRLGVLQPRSVDPAGAPPHPRHVPRLGGRGPDRPGDVAGFWEGGSLVRRRAFEAAGGWPGSFFYGHEGIELAWRVIDDGYRVRYQPAVGVLNPPADPFRGERHRYLDGRNRVWVARRNLPLPFLVAYVLVWLAASVLRAPDRAARRALVRGFVDGARTPCGPRRPIRWRTCWILTRLGRPPIV
jgi:GT2 family glycosyltransferase